MEDSGSDLSQEAFEESASLSMLENQAHAKKVLLSSDAMRYFLTKVKNADDRTSVLDTVLAKARVSFPSEDGWVVLNLVRMEELLEEINGEQDHMVSAEKVDLSADVKAMPAGSLAEAIITGNVVAAYQMIAHRPMVALADAASDLDAIYRLKKGETAVVSQMLEIESEKLTLPQLEGAIAALTSALDGTYTDEASAVKMAIMKAVKAVS